VSHVAFNYKTETWTTESFDLPCYDNEYVLLTPKDILTKDDTWINKSDLFEDFQRIVDSVSNETLRSQLNNYFISNLPKPKKTKSGKEKEPTKSEIFAAINAVLNKYPELIDYYIKYKEENGDKAISVSQQKVEIVETIFIHMLSGFIRDLKKQTGFFVLSGDTLDESYKRALFLKNVIENKDGYRIFYINGSPIKREEDIQIMFRLTWYASDCDVTREANEGRGPVDYKVSRGAADKTLIEFKLASNKKLKQNLQFQVAIYQQAHDTNKKVIVILFFTAKEEQRTKKILQELGLDNEKYIVLIDARNDNKPSASKAKSK